MPQASARTVRRATATALAALAAVLGGACSPRRIAPDPATYRDHVAPIVEARCATEGCHSGADPAASYSLSACPGGEASCAEPVVGLSYLRAMGEGTDRVPNLLSGDVGSLFLTKIADEPDTDHALDAEEVELLRLWIVQGAFYFWPGNHPGGWLDPTSGESHAWFLRGTRWDLSYCRRCHGLDYGGGEGPSCRRCHLDAEGPQACGTCHSAAYPENEEWRALYGARPTWRGLYGITDPAYPGVGAHRTHAAGGRVTAAGFDCTECHIEPFTMGETRHIDLTPGAEIVFGALATNRGAPAAYDPAAERCSGVFCHGATLTGGAVTAPVWTRLDGTQAGCDSCHGLPPPYGHTETDGECWSCHGTVILNETGAFSDLSLHINGLVDYN